MSAGRGGRSADEAGCVLRSSEAAGLRTTVRAVLVAVAVAALLILARRRFADRLPPRPEIVVRAAPANAVMALDSEPGTIRFGTPEGQTHEVLGFERSAPDPAKEPSATLRRRSEMRLRWSTVEPRAAILDLEVPRQSRYRVLRVWLNGHKVASLELDPGRRRYAFDLPLDRQQVGGNVLAFVFQGARAETQAETGTETGAEDSADDRQVAPHVFGLAVGRPSPTMEALARASLPFSTWREGDDVVQAGPSRLVWALMNPEGARLGFDTVKRTGEPTFRVEAETVGGERREIWRGGAKAGVTVDLPGHTGDLLRVWLHVESADGKPAWGVWKGLALTGAAPPSADRSPAPVVAAARPRLATSNVLVVVLDAAGARHFGCYGHTRRTSPNIDRIAAEGTVFDRAYTPAVFTRSAMASVWTSQLPDEHHASVSYDEPLPASVPTLAEAASAAGVLTAGFVGNDMAGSAFGLDRGFSEFHSVSPHADVLGTYVQGWLARHADRRFLAYVHYREPHYPYDPPPPFNTMFGPDAPLPRSAKTDTGWLQLVNEGSIPLGPGDVDHVSRLYDGNLALVDQEIGRLRAQLERLGLWDRTVVIVTGDHGEAMYEHGFIGHNEQVYEESVRIPLIVHFPRGTLPGGRRVGSLTGLLDLAPTVADILGIPKERTPTFRGRSLLEAVAGGPDMPPEAVLARTARAQPHYAWIGARYKYHLDTRGGEDRMFDLTADPGERTDLLASEPVRAEYYRQRLFAALLALPGRTGPSASGWSVPAEQREALRALGYVQ
jgi:arylsulfatase